MHVPTQHLCVCVPPLPPPYVIATVYVTRRTESQSAAAAGLIRRAALSAREQIFLLNYRLSGFGANNNAIPIKCTRAHFVIENESRIRLVLKQIDEAL
jgi:hypothetical protein